MVKITGTGDARLRLLVNRLEAIANEALTRKVSVNLQEEALALVRKGFQTSTNPYGERWKPLKVRKGMPLIDTARLRNSFARRAVTNTGFGIGTNVAYMSYHQEGTRRIAQRLMVPTAERGMGPVWTPRFVKIAEALMRKHMTGR
jgi:phage gpG-like protein